MNELIQEEINSAAYEICQTGDIPTEVYFDEIVEILEDLIKNIRDLEE